MEIKTSIFSGPDVTVRQAHLEDSEMIASWNGFLVASHKSYSAAKYLQEDLNFDLDSFRRCYPSFVSRYIIAFVSDKPAGYIYFGCDLGAIFSNISELYVSPEHRGKGVAKALIQYAATHTDIKASPFLTAEIWAENASSFHTFRSQGFIPCRYIYVLDKETLPNLSLPAPTELRTATEADLEVLRSQGRYSRYNPNKSRSKLLVYAKDPTLPSMYCSPPCKGRLKFYTQEETECSAILFLSYITQELSNTGCAYALINSNHPLSLPGVTLLKTVMQKDLGAV